MEIWPDKSWSKPPSRQKHENSYADISADYSMGTDKEYFCWPEMKYIINTYQHDGCWR